MTAALGHLLYGLAIIAAFVLLITWLGLLLEATYRATEHIVLRRRDWVAFSGLAAVVLVFAYYLGGGS